MTHKHHDFLIEAERLDETKKFIENFIEVIKLNEKQHIQDIRQAFIDLDYLDSSQSYITILTSTKLMEYGRENFRKLEAAKDKPYFARIDFRREDSSKFQKYYIGKLSLADDAGETPLIIDWRAPVANMYYEDRLGEASYESPSGTVCGELGLKRQLSIENGNLFGPGEQGSC